MTQRTLRQSKAMHLWFRRLAETLNAAGLDQKVVLSKWLSAPWSGTSVKEGIWKPMQHAMFGKKSTTQLSKSEVGRVEQVLVRELQEKFGVEVPEWPHYESEEAYLNETTS